MARTLGLHAQALEAIRALATKRGRREQGRFVVEGSTMLAEAVGANLEPERLYVTERGGAGIASLLERYDDRTFLVDERTMARLSELESPPGLLAVFPLALTTIAALLASGGPIAALAGVSDPGNAGTLVRTAEIFGFSGVVFVGDAVEPYNPKVVRATMGAVFRLPIAVATAQDLVHLARKADYTIVAAARDGCSLADYRFPKRPIIAIGNERHGVDHVLTQYDQTVSIPHVGPGESLNASIAGGIIFYAFSQQRADTISDDRISKKA